MTDVPVRTRTRLIPPLGPARIRVRQDVTTLLPTLGEVVNGVPPNRWHGWPNGSCVDLYGGRIHKGRIIHRGNRYHVLRWSPVSRTYRYILAHDKFDMALLAL